MAHNDTVEDLLHDVAVELLKMAMSAKQRPSLRALTTTRAAISRGNFATRNSTGHALVEEILGNRGTTFTQRTTGRLGEVLDVVAHDGRGLRFGADGKFVGLLEPPR